MMEIISERNINHMSIHVCQLHCYFLPTVYSESDIDTVGQAHCLTISYRPSCGLTGN